MQQLSGCEATLRSLPLSVQIVPHRLACRQAWNEENTRQSQVRGHIFKMRHGFKITHFKLAQKILMFVQIKNA